jgi:hypothetical protein
VATAADASSLEPSAGISPLSCTALMESPAKSPAQGSGLPFTRRRRRLRRRGYWPPPTSAPPGQRTTCRHAPQEMPRSSRPAAMARRDSQTRLAWRPAAKEPNYRHRRLLRMRCPRPRRCAAKQCDKLTTLHVLPSGRGSYPTTASSTFSAEAAGPPISGVPRIRP